MKTQENEMNSESAKASATTVTPKKVGTNPYLANDGLLDFKKLSVLNTKVTKAVKDYLPIYKKTKTSITVIGLTSKNAKEIADLVSVSEILSKKDFNITRDAKTKTFTLTINKAYDTKNSKQLIENLGESFPPSPSVVLALGIKAKFEDFNSTRHRKGTQFTYLNRRCAAVKERTRETDKMNVLLRVYAKGVLDKTLEKQVLLAQKALVTHTKASVKVKERIGKARGVLKDQKSKALDAAITELVPLLGQAGIKESDIVVGTSVMGQKTVYIKLPKLKQVLTVGLGDVGAMNKAKKENTQ